MKLITLIERFILWTLVWSSILLWHIQFKRNAFFSDTINRTLDLIEQLTLALLP